MQKASVQNHCLMLPAGGESDNLDIGEIAHDCPWMRPLASDRRYFVTRCAVRLMSGRNQGERNILYLNQRWRR